MRISDWSSDVCSSDLEETRVRLKLEDGSVYPLEGTLKFSEVTVDEGTGSVVLRATFPNPQGKLLPGMFVHAQLQSGLRPDAILVPQQAVSRDPSGQALVWVVGEDGIANPRKVQTLRTVGNTRSEEHTSELQSLMRTSYAVFCFTKKN